MNKLCFSRKKITTLCLILLSFLSFNSNSQTSCAPVATIDEDFENFTTFPENCWSWKAFPDFVTPPTSTLVSLNSSVSPVKKSVAIFAKSYSSHDFYLILPPVNTINGNYLLKFDARLLTSIGNGSTIQIGTLQSTTSVASFTPAGSVITPTTTNKTYRSIAIPAIVGHNYVAIKFSPSANNSLLIIDNVSWQQAPVAIQSVNVTTQNSVPATITTTNGTLQLGAVVNPTTANQNITWSVDSGTTFASVDNTGLVTALANGTAVIKATSVADPTISGSISVTINAPTASPCTQVATIDEDFETFTTFPENCWLSNKTSPMAELDSNATSGNHFISLYSFMSANEPIYLVSPELSTIDGNHLLEFDIVSTNAPLSNIEVGTMTNNTDFSTFLPVGTSFNPTVATHSSAFIPASAGHKYIAIKYIPNGQHQAVSIDNVKWKTTASSPKFDTSKVMVYPNPTSGIINVDSTLNIAQVEIYNATGQKVLTTTNKEINLQSAANGLYFVTVTTNEGLQGTYKIIKNN